MIEKILVPDIGDFDEVDVVQVQVTAGDRVAVEDPLITLESDKATMDVPSPLAGRVVDVSVKAGDKVGEGALILTLQVEEATGEEETTEVVAKESQASPPQPRAAAPPSAAPPESLVPPPAATGERHSTTPYASPAVRRYARELGVDLNRVKGTGRKQRILREDVQAFVKKIMAEPAASGGSALPPMPVIDFSKFGDIERQPLSRIQRPSLASVHRSWLHVPHVTQHDEADVTDMEAFRKAQAGEAKSRGVKLTPVAFVMKAAVATLKEFPKVNSSLEPDGEHVVLKKYYHLGIAVDTEQGLVVPVVRDVDSKGIFDLAAELGEISERARQGKLRLDEVQGASFTITSLGGIGGTAFTPIVNAPEVAILGISRLVRRPVWNGEEFEPRLMLPLSLSYDHRVIDGALAVRFTTRLCQNLSDLRRLLL